MATATSICYFSLSSSTAYSATARIDGSADTGTGTSFNARIGSTALAGASFQSNSYCAWMLLSSTQHDRTASTRDELLAKSPERKPAAARKPRLISNLSSTSRNSSNFQWEEPYGDVMLTNSTYKPGSECKLLPPPHRSQADQFDKKLKFWIIRGTTSTEGYAAATLRAQCFYSYPAFTPTTTDGLELIKARLKHEHRIQKLVESKAKSEFERDAKMESANMNVRCLLAVCKASTHEELCTSLHKEKNTLPSMAPPTLHSPAFTSERLVALGSLDIQDGTGTKATVDVNTVTFQLYNLANTSKKKRGVSRGKISEPGRGRSLLSLSSGSGQSQSKHGYIFNLSVTESARRYGVATALMREAEQVSKEMQLGTIYVHVDEDNDLALALYQKLGYVIREVEDVDLVARFQRPRRILLSYSFQ